MTVTQDRNWGLDLMRAVAVLSVIFSHFLQHLDGYDTLKSFNKLFGGLYGVEVFFVLSGFLIGRIVLKDFAVVENHKYSLYIFWYRRWMRTLPAYYFYLLCYSIIAAVPAQQANIVQYVFFLQNFAWQTSPGFFGVSWSLTIEEMFYLILPLFYLATSFIKSSVESRSVLAISMIFILACAIKLYFYQATDIMHVDARKFTVLRVDAILYGVMVAHVYIYNPNLFRWMASISIFSLLPFLIFKLYFVHMSFFGSEIGYIVKFMIAPAMLALVIPFMASINIAPRGLFGKFVSFTSKISYSLYLSHIIAIIITNSFFHLTGLKELWVIGVYFVLAYLMSWVSYHLIESPFIRNRDRGLSMIDSLLKKVSRA